MPTYTDRLNLEVPAESDAADVPYYIGALADRLDTIIPPFSAVSSLPAAGNEGFLYLLTTNSVFYLDTGSVLLPLNQAQGTVTTTVPHTWAVSGPIAETSGEVGYLPPLVVPSPSGQSAAVLGVYTSLRTGNCDVAIAAGGSTIAGLGAVAVSSSQTWVGATDAPVALSNGEALQPTVTAVSNSPDGLSVTVLVAYTATI